MTTTSLSAETDVRYAVGAMTGTSIDGIDVALLRLRGRGLNMTAELIAASHASLGGLAPQLRAVAEQNPMEAGKISLLTRRFGELHAEVIAAIAENAPRIDLIAVHGQTVYHQPPLSWQLIDPWPIVLRFSAPVVCDFRSADLVSGGQGAPITPPADWIMFRSRDNSRAVINLGGFCNVTILPQDDGDRARLPAELFGADVCACNQVLDRLGRLRLGCEFDDGGQVAASGRIDLEIRTRIEEQLAAQHKKGRSLGTGDELAGQVVGLVEPLDDADALATAAAAIGRTIGTWTREKGAGELYIAGGGANHAVLVREIERAAASSCRLLASLGIAGSARESAAMAVLGALCRDGVAITPPYSCDSRDVRILAGAWYGLRSG